MAFAIDAAATIPDHFQGTKVQDSHGKKSFLQSPTAGEEWKRSLVVPWLVVCEDFVVKSCTFPDLEGNFSTIQVAEVDFVRGWPSKETSNTPICGSCGGENEICSGIDVFHLGCFGFPIVLVVLYDA